MHPEEADIGPVDLLKGEDGFGLVGKCLGYFPRLHKFVLHSWFNLDNLVAARQHADGHFAGFGHLFHLEIGVDVVLDMLTQFSLRQLCK